MTSINLHFQIAIVFVSARLSMSLFLKSDIETDILSSGACQNNGTKSSTINSVCECIPPWTGEFCTEYLCVHGLSVGYQFDDSSIFFNKRCICEAGYTGELCDIPLVNPCGAHGSQIGDKCSCNANYTGPKCEFVEFCLNGQLSSGRCNCNYGWSSDFCHIIICQQGYSDKANLTCTCRSGYRGTFCDFCAESERTTLYPECAPVDEVTLYKSKRFILATGAILIFVFVFFLIIFLVMRKRNQRLQRKRYGPQESNLKKRMRRMVSNDENDFL